jgi:hypothetical protein
MILNATTIGEIDAAFRNASIEGGKPTRWVTSDGFVMPARCPLLPE